MPIKTVVGLANQIPPVCVGKGFQVLAIGFLIARTPSLLGPWRSARPPSASSFFQRFIATLSLATLFFVLPQACYGANDNSESLAQHQEITVRDSFARVKAEATPVKALASEQKIICRQEFSESLANALEKAKEHCRKLRLEAVENGPRKRNIGM